MRYKVTHRLTKQQDDQLAILEVGAIQPIQNSQIAGEVVMGKVESASTQQAGKSFTNYSAAKELVWQRQVKVGDQLVYHQVKDDGYGCLSFFRASVNVSAGADVTLQKAASISPSAPPNLHSEPAIIPQDSPDLPATEPHCDSSSVRSAVKVGLAVNLLALTVGGYLLQFSPAGTEANFAQKTTEEHQHLGTVQNSVVPAQSIPSNHIDDSDVSGPAQALVEAQGHQLLQTAYRHAVAKDFAGAVNALKQIPQETSAFALAQTKIVEYSELQHLQFETQAHQLLQTAYNLAGESDFAGAISFIQQIPQGTVAYAKAEPKLAEYSQKQRIQAKTNGWNVGALPDPNPIIVSTLPAPVQISSLADFTAVSPHTGTRVLSSNLNPGNIFQEIAPKPAFLSAPETKIEG
ncbi:hypothetical protein [Microcoleus sp. FACHB-672]|uniref:hypothetical protein n=1 Tax=Microcoleus sp. FACHB-672 TaxID=2692825 RepID=UPI001686E9B8|nr:hypothetical protein [Microcoleus sp. FACHB-672]MBD2039542.1 hypothetical protein [Microcoleus sp. FACHB-672]